MQDKAVLNLLILEAGQYQWVHKIEIIHSHLTKKKKKLALKCALSDKIHNDEVIFIDSLEIKSHKTKDLSNFLQNFTFNSALFIHGDEEKTTNFKRASSNIPKLAMLVDKGLNVKDLITFDKIFIEKNSRQM